ncbi:MAG: potassium transporter [Burkholderiaceae bacterium]|nr:MAG: potassium transporter [Burkholderiaceae bacterium]
MHRWNPGRTYLSYKRFRKTGQFNASPPLLLAIGFLTLIALGTVLLSLPISTREPVSLFQALFTAVSAVTVTGLTLVNVSTTFTHFGQVIIALLVQIGGLGFVTFAVIAVRTMGKKISLQQQALALEAFNQTSLAKVQRTAFAIFKITAVIEVVGAIILTLRWWPGSNFIDALSRALFHTVMAFNNSGFALQTTQLSLYVSDPVTILTTTLLIILGGIGFSVLSDVSGMRRWSKLAPYTRLAILVTLALNLAGFVLLWMLEYNNYATLGTLSLHGQALAAWLQSVSSRTAGFSSINIGQLSDSSKLVIIILMFIGGGSLSTASGIKIGTFAVLVAAARSYIFQRSEVVLMRRSVSPDTVQKALALLLVTIGLALISVLLITVFDHAPFIDIVFEVVTALSTTGMSNGLTAHLSVPSQSLIIILMFAGRLGPLTLIYSLATQSRSRIRYAETEIQVG